MTSVASRPRISVLRALWWFAVSYGLALIGYAAINAVAGRWLGRANFGLFVVVLTASAAIGQLALLGTDRGGLRDAARLTGGDGEENRRDSLWQLRQDALVASRISLPVAAVLSGVVTFTLVSGPLDRRLAVALGFAAMVQLSGAQKLWSNYLRGLGYIRFASLLEGRSGGALVSLSQAVVLLLAWQAAPQTGLAGAVVALVVGFAIPVPLAGAVVARKWRHLDQPHHHLLRTLPDTIRRNWRFVANQFAVAVAGTLEIWMAGALLSPHGSSEFAAAQRIALLLSIPTTSLQVVFAPVAARMLGSGRGRALEPILRTGSTAAFVITSVLWVPMLLWPEQLLELMYGTEFGSAATALMLLTLGNVANVFVGLAGTALTMSHHEGAVAAVQSGSIVLRLAVGTAAALAFGVNGLAAAAAGISILTYGAVWWQSRRLLGINTAVTLRPSLKLLRSTSS